MVGVEEHGGHVMKNMDVQITQQLLKEYMDYSPDGYLIWKVDRNHIKAGTKAGYTMNHGYTAISFFGKPYLAHRLIWLYHYGYLPSCHMDHINRVRTDNRIENLRLAKYNQADNNQNQKVRKDSKSGVPGVTWNKRSNKWIVRIQVYGDRMSLGYFESFEEAVKARERAKLKYHWFNPVDNVL